MLFSTKKGSIFVCVCAASFLLTACAAAKEETPKQTKKGTCEVQAKSNEININGQLNADLNCNLPASYQGKKLFLSYDKELVQVALEEDLKQTTKAKDNNGRILLTLPREETFNAKLTLTGLKKGSGKLDAKVLSTRAKWNFEVVLANNGAKTTPATTQTPVTPKPKPATTQTPVKAPVQPKLPPIPTAVATLFTKMQDAGGKAYGRSVLRIDTSQMLVSNTTYDNCPNTANTLLISHNDFTNCDGVYVQKGVATNHVVIPRQTWRLSETYKVGVRKADGTVVKFQKSGVDITFATNSNDNPTANLYNFDIGTLVSGKNFKNGLHLESDGEIWILDHYTRGNAPTFSSDHCSNMVPYAGQARTKFRTINSKPLGSDTTIVTGAGASGLEYYIYDSNGGNLSFAAISGNQSGVNAQRLVAGYFLCWTVIPKRS